MTNAHAELQAPHYRQSIVADLLDFIGTSLMGGANDLESTTPLLALGIIDSLSMVSVVTFVKERYGVEVRGQDVTVANFATVDALARLIERHSTTCATAD